MIYREGNINDLKGLQQLAIEAWKPYQQVLEPKHWERLEKVLSNENTYRELLNQSQCLVCESAAQKIIGKAYLVPQGNPTDIYDKAWSYIRFLSVHPDFAGKGIGRKLTEKCIDYAKENGEQVVALHTSEIMHKARALYENLGFNILREIEPRLGKRYWLYWLTLDESHSTKE